MFGLFYGFWKELMKQDEYRVLILGLDNAGKTTFLEALKNTYLNTPHIPPEKIAPTVGLNLGVIEVGRVKLTFWDLGGQETLHPIWEKYFRESDAIIYIVDAHDVDRLPVVKRVLSKLIYHKVLATLPMLILANKQDMINALTPHELMSELKEFSTFMAGKRDCRVDKLVALRKEGIQEAVGVKEAVDWILKGVQRNRSARNLKVSESS